jgi:hypothetical protein
MDSIVGFSGGQGKGEFAEQDGWRKRPAPSLDIRRKIHEQIDSVFAFLDRPKDTRSFHEVEQGLLSLVFALGRLFVAYFLARREECFAETNGDRVNGRWCKARPRQKVMGTFFGRVRYWRRSLKRVDGAAFYPLDAALGLTADGFSMLVMSLKARLSTLLTYDQVTAILLRFTGWSPSKTSVEKAVLGFGRYTAEWFEKAPPRAGDGEILVIQFDGKAAPTATEEELAKRRQKRPAKSHPRSQRHRGRAARARRGTRKRRKKGDKSKNGKVATQIVMYTLKPTLNDKGVLELHGPINKWVYSSFAPKRHAFAIARREADKRGFTKESGKRTQIVTDGDEDLALYTKELFPGAIHTLDVMHVMEYLWEAGRLLFGEGTTELATWIQKLKKLLYGGKEIRLIERLCEEIAKIPKTGPGTCAKRARLTEIRDYLAKRINQMNYKWLREEDLEIASGLAEGAVRHVIGKRFDYGSMRWIKERAEPLLQLRCIEINGDWDRFVEFVHAKLLASTLSDTGAPTLLTRTVADLPQLGLTG